MERHVYELKVKSSISNEDSNLSLVLKEDISQEKLEEMIRRIVKDSRDEFVFIDGGTEYINTMKIKKTFKDKYADLIFTPTPPTTFTLSI